MESLQAIADIFKEKLSLKFSPVGFCFSDVKPTDALGLKKAGSGCIMPLIFASAKGKTVAFDENTTGWACSGFYLGYKEWIFPGIENFLSDVPIAGRECEKFIKTPGQAKEYLESVKFKELSKGYAVFKPLERFSEAEKPEVVIFFANADQLSAMVYLLHFNCPIEENRVVTRFASACAAVTTLPLMYSRLKEKKAVWGMHDISARARLPKDLMTLAMPFDLLIEIGNEIENSFLTTHAWEVIRTRIKTDE